MKMRVLHIQNYWSIHFYGTSFFLIRSMTFILMSVSDSWIRFSVVRWAVRSLLAHSLLMLFFPEAGGPRIMTCGTGEKSIQCTFKSFAETQFYTYIIAHHPYSCMNVAVTISGSFLLLYIISIFSTPILIHELPDFHCSMFIDNSIPLKGINLRAHMQILLCLLLKYTVLTIVIFFFQLFHKKCQRVTWFVYNQLLHQPL